MEKRLKKYNIQVREMLDNDKLPKNFFELHKQKIAEFHGERMAHLHVTLFFAGLAIIAIASRLFLTQFFDGSVYGIILNIASGLIALILVVLEIFYVRHYFQLENGLQKVYKLTDEIFEKSNSK